MQFVQPIKNKNSIEEMKKNLLEDGKKKEYLLFVIGINSGLRISDILTLKWKDLDGAKIKKTEKKTGKTKIFPANDSIKKALKMFSNDEKAPEDFVFESSSKRNGKTKQAWKRQYPYVFLNQYAKEAGIDEPVGTHTMRKTFGYFVFTATKDIAMVQKLLNHSSTVETLRYIGITQMSMDAIYNGLNL